MALSASNSVTAQLLDGVWPYGHVDLYGGTRLLGAVVLFYGVSSRWAWQVRHDLPRHG